MFNAAKDAISSRVGQAWMNKAFARYGEVQHLKIDSRRKTVEVSCLLEGETTPIAIRIENYVVESEAGKTFVRVNTIHCSRPWLQNLLTDLATRQRLELPAWAAAAL
jgi:ribosomal protein L22